MTRLLHNFSREQRTGRLFPPLITPFKMPAQVRAGIFYSLHVLLINAVVTSLPLCRIDKTSVRRGICLHTPRLRRNHTHALHALDGGYRSEHLVRDVAVYVHDGVRIVLFALVEHVVDINALARDER